MFSECVMQSLPHVSNKEKEAGATLGMSNRKGLSRTDQDESRSDSGTKLRCPEVVL